MTRAWRDPYRQADSLGSECVERLTGGVMDPPSASVPALPWHFPEGAERGGRLVPSWEMLISIPLC